jgi:DHA1 family bicyclomycin/chloramphenicol resistance-like MFS transporter
MHSTVALATASLAMLSLGLLSWTYIRHRWPEIGLNISHG